MEVNFAYGSTGLRVQLPTGRTTVVAPHYPPPLADPRAAVRAAVRCPVSGPPLRDRVRRGQSVAIAICDGTRPQPRSIVVPVLLEELEGLARPEDIVVLVATGTHRGNTHSELVEMLGEDVLGAVRVVNHDARDEGALTWAGRHGKDVPVWLNSEWLAADVRVSTGFVEPHFFAGFSGGPKLVAPGLAGLETTLTLHDAARIGHPQARWGVTVGNPVHDDVRAIAAGTGVTFALDVALDSRHRILAAFGGDLLAMHAVACGTVMRWSMRQVAAPFDVVVTSNAGFPLDQNLYQAVKGMSAGAQVVKPGGLVICVAECRDGFPDHGSYRSELVAAKSVAELGEAIARRAEVVPDQWQLQIQASIMARARVIVSTRFIADEDLAAAHLEQTHDVARTVGDAGPRARVCAMPAGPMTVPYLN
ncbi:MAG TPA: nickel-dependent lactate racemase [Acidimicrobiales bacterium]|nr:nickel-dependent lactate racemase [Acidimicrobiales bacterium]